ncbi:MAG: methyltransferase, TIGR04325 family [Candidatus Pedobacter colombiensis]|uniref:Methyltransferase, TIGR04325 family n=1 Tax=Candidatus Pedobacter colombiensis TaxID=3121371 RepID=A0AAJ5W8W7_9SPHI|nr:methyltransferase, TIGR04325 family [Pedobacter sp.]WEK19184.1 MAG: methyltransferase, TIGR04325 family [Pedobacter sp.]
MFKIKNAFKKKPKNVNQYGWFGNFNSWNEAKSSAFGYEASNILEKTKQSLLKIKNGEAIYERDSVLFDKKEYPYSIISSLLYIAIKNNNKLNVVDFGGSLGSTWFQVRDFIPSEIEVSWSIVEQAAYIDEGKKYFADDVLDFYYTIEDCIAAKKNVNVVLLSSVVQYLEKPHEFLDQLSSYQIDYLLFDRTAFINEPSLDRLTLQIVPPEIYEARYPSWFFNEARFLNHFSSYQLKADFFSFVEGERFMSIDHKVVAYDKGFLFEKKK